MSDAVAERRCFVVSPIGEKGDAVRTQADKVLKHIVRAALEPDYTVHRADDDTNPGAITPQIIRNILEADLIVADISGGNANVFYELAIAHGYDKPTVHIQSAGHRVPFDIKDMRVIAYDIQDLDSVEDAKKALKESAAFAAADPAKVETPLRGAENFKAVKESGDPAAHVQAQILDGLAELKAIVAHKVSLSDPLGAGSTGDLASYKAIVSRAGRTGRLKPTDFHECITMRTSSEFDAWARMALGTILKVSDERSLNSMLFDSEMMAEHPDQWEPPF